MASKKRIAVYVDGFNLYHALKNLKKNHLKWLNLRALAEKFINPREEAIEAVFYFSAIATHIQNNPAIRIAKAENNTLEMNRLTPPTYTTHDSLRQNIRPGKSSVITEGHIMLSLLPASIKKPNGKIIHRPEEYTHSIK